MCTPPFPCAECNRTPVQTTGRVIYPHRPDLWHKFFYRCSCGAYVGCHPALSPIHGAQRRDQISEAKTAALSPPHVRPQAETEA